MYSTLVDAIESIDTKLSLDSELYHHGIKGQHWGERRYQNKDGSLTPEGKQRYGIGQRAKNVANAIRKKINPNKQELDDELKKAEHKRDIRAEKKQIKDVKGQFKRKRVKDMSNEEIQAQIDRLVLERNLKDMKESAKLSKGREAFNNAIKEAANRTASNAIQTIGGAIATKIATSITGNNQYKLAEREAELQLNYLNDKDKHAERRSKSGEMLEDYYTLIGKKRDGNKTSEVRKAKDEALDALEYRVLQGDKEAAKDLRRYKKAISNSNNGKKQNDKTNKRINELEKKIKNLGNQPNQPDQPKKQPDQPNQPKNKQKGPTQQEYDAEKKRANDAEKLQQREAEKRKRAEAIAKKNAQKAASEAKIAAEQKKKADGLVQAWAKHKYSERIENPDGSFTYIYGDDYQRYMATKMGLGKMS